MVLYRSSAPLFEKSTAATVRNSAAMASGILCVDRTEKKYTTNMITRATNPPRDPVRNADNGMSKRPRIQATFKIEAPLRVRTTSKQNGRPISSRAAKSLALEKVPDTNAKRPASLPAELLPKKKLSASMARTDTA